VAVGVDQPRQQGMPPSPASRGLCILPLLREVRSLAGKQDPVALENHRAVGDDGERGDEATRQQDAWVGAHL